MASSAQLVVSLGAADVTRVRVVQGRAATGGKVDAVVAGTTSHAIGRGLPVVTLCSLGAIVALDAIAEVLRIGDVIERDATVAITSLAQFFTHVQFVDEVGNVANCKTIDLAGGAGIARCGGRCLNRTEFALIRVAGHAKFGVLARAGMELEAGVALKAGRDADDFALRVARRHCLARCGNEVIEEVEALLHGGGWCAVRAVRRVLVVRCRRAGAASCAADDDRQTVRQARVIRQVIQIRCDLRSR